MQAQLSFKEEVFETTASLCYYSNIFRFFDFALYTSACHRLWDTDRLEVLKILNPSNQSERDPAQSQKGPQWVKEVVFAIYPARVTWEINWDICKGVGIQIIHHIGGCAQNYSKASSNMW